MKRLAVISASLLMLGFGGKSAFAQEKAKADKATGGRTDKVYEGRFSLGKKARKWPNSGYGCSAQVV